MTSLKSITSLNSFFYYVITDPACFLENNILKQYFIKSAFCEKTTTGGEQQYSSLKDVVVLNSVFPGGFFWQKNIPAKL